MNKLLPISLVVLMIILAVAYSMKKKCVCVNGRCSKCSGFSFAHFFDKKEKFSNGISEVPGFYATSPVFPELKNKKTPSDYWV